MAKIIRSTLGQILELDSWDNILLCSSLSFSRANGSFSTTYIILNFLFESYKIAELQAFVNLQLTPLKHQKV